MRGRPLLCADCVHCERPGSAALIRLLLEWATLTSTHSARRLPSAAGWHRRHDPAQDGGLVPGHAGSGRCPCQAPIREHILSVVVSRFHFFSFSSLSFSSFLLLQFFLFLLFISFLFVIFSCTFLFSISLFPCSSSLLHSFLSLCSDLRSLFFSSSSFLVLLFLLFYLFVFFSSLLFFFLFACHHFYPLSHLPLSPPLLSHLYLSGFWFSPLSSSFCFTLSSHTLFPLCSPLSFLSPSSSLSFFLYLSSLSSLSLCSSCL